MDWTDKATLSLALIELLILLASDGPTDSNRRNQRTSWSLPSLRTAYHVYSRLLISTVLLWQLPIYPVFFKSIVFLLEKPQDVFQLETIQRSQTSFKTEHTTHLLW